MKNLYRAYFIRRVNRFVVTLHLFSPEGKCMDAYLPNPGRLWELFYRGSELILEKGSKGSKYPYVIIGVLKNNRVVFLHTLRNNDLAEHLLRNRLIPGLEKYRILRREAPSPQGNSRFDFLLEKEGEPCYLEVKSCSLFQGAMAMFPDAPTERGRRHLLELKELHEEGYQCAVLIIVQDDEAGYFLPEYHTDPDFADAFLQCREALQFYAVGSRMEGDMVFPESVKTLKIPWKILEEENKDRGCYILLLEIPRKVQLGEREYPPGFYLLPGYCSRELQKHMNRLLRKRKQAADRAAVLRRAATGAKALALRSSVNPLEELITDLSALFEELPAEAPERLFYSMENPLGQQPFIERLLYFRMERPLIKVSE